MFGLEGDDLGGLRGMRRERKLVVGRIFGCGDIITEL